jgi:S1-C subfamily serine protease
MNKTENTAEKCTPSTKPAPISFCALAKTLGPHGGLIVQTADKLSSAGKAGILAGDEIIALNDLRPRGVEEALRIVEEAGVGATVYVQLIRGDARATLPVELFAKTLSLDLDDLDEVVERKIAPAA